jgi:predicted amidohydrolase YtcJ
MISRSSILFIAILALNSCTMKKADLIIYNAKIYTVDDSFSTAEAMAVKEGKVIAIGSSNEIRKYYQSKEQINASGKFIYPGFHDAHSHFWEYAEGLNAVNLVGTSSFDEVIERIAQYIETNPSKWISGWGWDQNDWESKAFPSNKLLDKQFPGKAIVLSRIDGHAVLASSEAIKLSGLTINDYPEELVIQENGIATGVFLEGAGDVLKKAIPRPGEIKMKELLTTAQKNCFAVGLTHVNDAGLKFNQVKFLQSLYEKKELSIGLDVWLSPEQENITLVENGPVLNGPLTISAFKLYADGALGSRGACLLKPYSDENTSGVIVEQPDFYRSWCKTALEHNIQVATHCIGDSVNRLILDIYGEFLKGKNDRRWRIEHAQVVNPVDVPKYGEFSVIPSVQPTHATSDMYWAAERLGERIKDSYIYQSLLQRNGWLANGSDFPVEDINPLYGFYAAVARKDQNGWPAQGFQKREALTREQALRAMTIWAAKSNFTEDRAGSLEVGKEADFVVLGQDIMTIAEHELFKVNVEQVFKKGTLVYTN